MDSRYKSSAYNPQQRSTIHKREMSTYDSKKMIEIYIEAKDILGS